MKHNKSNVRSRTRLKRPDHPRRFPGQKPFPRSANGPADRPYPITPSDTADLPAVPKGIYVGTGGDVVLQGIGGGRNVTCRNLADGSYIAVRARYVRATGTTAANLVGEA